MVISEITPRGTPPPSPTPEGSDRSGENLPSLYALAACPEPFPLDRVGWPDHVVGGIFRADSADPLHSNGNRSSHRRDGLVPVEGAGPADEAAHPRRLPRLHGRPTRARSPS